VRKLLDGLYLTAAAAGALCVVAICTLMLGQSWLREAGVDTGGTTDIVSWLCAAAAFLTMPHAFKHGDFVNVTLVLERLGPPMRRRFDIAVLLIACVAVGYLALSATRFTWESWTFHDLSTGIISIPIWIPQASFVFGSWLLFIAVLDELINVLRGSRPSYVVAVEQRHTQGDFSADI
jgi:TRAP-type C4-dicarboxylate transport system permease small subunit